MAHPKKTRREAVQLMKAGIHPREIAASYGIPLPTVYSWRWKAGKHHSPPATRRRRKKAPPVVPAVQKAPGVVVAWHETETEPQPPRPWWEGLQPDSVATVICAVLLILFFAVLLVVK